MNNRFHTYEPSTTLRRAIGAYRQASAARIEDDRASGRAQEVNSARDAPGTGAVEGGGTTRRTGDEDD
jgi:hypothetical protein